MKKMRWFFMVAMAALLVTACSNNDDVRPDDNDGGTQFKGDAYIALSLKTNASTRALNNPEIENGTYDETKINDVQVWFFGADKKLVEQYTLLSSMLGQPEGIPSAAFKITSAAKYLLVVANPSVTLKEMQFSVGTDYLDINAVIALTGDQEAVLNDVIKSTNGFMMTNASGTLMPVDDYGTLQELTLHKTAASAEAEPVVIRIDRVVAKVRVLVQSHMMASVSTRSAGTTRAGADVPYTVKGVQWVLNVTNKKYFPVSERAKTQRELDGLGGPIGSDLYNKGSYRVDPNYDGSNYSAWQWGGGYGANFNYYTQSNQPSSWNTAHYDPSETAVAYCLENTQEAQYNMHAYTTQVLIKACLLPLTQTWLYSDGSWSSTKDAPSQPKDFLKIGGGSYTENSLLSWLKYELWNKHTIDLNTSTPLFDAFNDVLDEASIEELDDPFNDGIISQQEYEERIHELEEAFATAFQALNPDTYSNGNVSFYKEGISYYKIMIKHDDDKGLNGLWNELGEFGVVRNSVYDITINTISGPGYPTIPEPDPTIPDEEETTEEYISVRIDINPWNWYSQGEDL